jgi:hypothetical protein
VVFSTVPAADFPGRSSLLRAASLAVALAGSALLWGWSDSFQRLYITGAYLIAIKWPFYEFFIFSALPITR